MTGIINPTRIGISLDVDGTLIDSNRECYKRVGEVYQHTGDAFDLNYDQFHSFRPWVGRVEDYFAFTEMFKEHECLPDNAKELKEDYLKDPKMIEMKELFYKFRKEQMGNNKNRWVLENSVYEGVSEMMDNLGKTPWNVFVVTSKNMEAVSEILSYHGLDKNLGKIYDKDDGKTREEQFIKAAGENGLEMKNIIPYDDLPKQLNVAKDLGMDAVGAPQGYGMHEELEVVGFPLAYPNEFIATVESILRKR